MSYEGRTEGIVFSRNGETLTDLFVSFDNVLPGDILTDTVELQNNSPDGGNVSVFLRALDAEAGGGDFLSQLRLTATAQDGALSQIHDREAAQLSDWVLLGTLAPGGRATLALRLEVPLSLGNEYQSATGQFVWRFKGEELDPSPSSSPSPAPSAKPAPGSSPKTGDEFRPGLYAALAGASAAAVVWLLITTKKKQKKK